MCVGVKATPSLGILGIVTVGGAIAGDFVGTGEFGSSAFRLSEFPISDLRPKKIASINIRTTTVRQRQ